MTTPNRSSDWSDKWTPETPVEIDFHTEPPSYLSIDAAVARLVDDYGSEEAVRLLLSDGRKVQRFSGTTYQLLDHGREA